MMWIVTQKNVTENFVWYLRECIRSNHEEAYGEIIAGFVEMPIEKKQTETNENRWSTAMSLSVLNQAIYSCFLIAVGDKDSVR